MNTSADTLTINFDNSYITLTPEFYQRQQPTPVSDPTIIAINDALAAELGIDAESLRSSYGVSVLAGNTIAKGSDPIAMAYAGHQFGGFNPQLGDGRAVLFVENVLKAE